MLLTDVITSGCVRIIGPWRMKARDNICFESHVCLFGWFGLVVVVVVLMHSRNFCFLFFVFHQKFYPERVRVILRWKINPVGEKDTVLNSGTDVLNYFSSLSRLLKTEFRVTRTTNTACFDINKNSLWFLLFRKKM